MVASRLVTPRRHLVSADLAIALAGLDLAVAAFIFFYEFNCLWEDIHRVPYLEFVPYNV